jgi:predicted dienelactone hydrolase
MGTACAPPAFIGKPLPVQAARSALTIDGGTHAVPIWVWYPLAGGDYPIVVFSPGAGAEVTDYAYLLEYWAKHGFTVIGVTPEDTQRREAAERDDVDEFAWDAQLQAMLHDPVVWRERVQAVETVAAHAGGLNYAIKEPHPGFANEPIAFAGHSFGSQTATLAADADPLVNAVLLFSPEPAGSLGITPSNYSSIRAPLMVMAGANEPLAAHLPASARYAVTVDRAVHETFSGQFDGYGSPNPEEIIRTVSLAFLDATLKHDAGAQAFLDAPPCGGGYSVNQGGAQRRKSFGP